MNDRATRLDMAEIGVPLSATNNGNMSVILCPQVGGAVFNGNANIGPVGC